MQTSVNEIYDALIFKGLIPLCLVMREKAGDKQAPLGAWLLLVVVVAVLSPNSPGVSS